MENTDTKEKCLFTWHNCERFLREVLDCTKNQEPLRFLLELGLTELGVIRISGGDVTVLRKSYESASVTRYTIF